MPPQSKVSLLRLPDYDEARVLTALRECLAPLGGMSAFVRPGQRVLLKPNMLAPFAPEQAVTTHPAVVKATLELVREAGGEPFVGDSPGVGAFRGVARASGIDRAMEETSAKPADFETEREFDVPDHLAAPKITLAQAVADADVIITLPKLKTHVQMTMTGALKNQYGLIPGTLKAHWHFRLQDRDWLAKLVLDINRTANPVLAVMDAVTAMEGEGPAGGRPRTVGALLAGADLTAVDVVACHLIGLDPKLVPVLRAAEMHDFGAASLDHIEVVGDDWRELCVPDFEKVTELHDILGLAPLPPSVLRWLRRHWSARPRIRAESCKKCGACARGCPVSPPAIDPSAPTRKQVDDERCIRCYCCHEFCPEKALELRQPWIGRVCQFQRLAHWTSRALGRLAALRK